MLLLLVLRNIFQLILSTFLSFCDKDTITFILQQPPKIEIISEKKDRESSLAGDFLRKRLFGKHRLTY